jgi:Protein of unknown function (DUF3102)
MSPLDTTRNEVAIIGFDYASLDPEVAIEAQAAAVRIREMGVRLGEVIVEIGRELAAVKARLGHGHFGDWIKTEFAMSADTAERYLRVAAAFEGKIRTVRILKPTTLYALTAKTTPEPVRNEIVTRTEAGKPLSDDEIKRALSEARKIAPKASPAPTPRSLPSVPPRALVPAAQARAKAIVGFSALLHQQLAATLDDLTRMLRDQRARIAELPLHKRVVLARGYLDALGVTLNDLRPIEDA